MTQAEDKSDHKKALGERMRQARESRGLSQIDIGEACGTTRAAVSLWERGESMPEPDKLERAANRLNVDPIWLQWGKGKAPVLKPPSDERKALRLINSTDLGWSNRLDRPPFEGAIPEMDEDIGEAAVYDGKPKVRDWWRIPNRVADNLNIENGKPLRVYRLAIKAVDLPKGTYVLVDTKQKTPVDNGIFALDNGVSIILKKLSLIVGDAKKIGLIDGEKASMQTVPLSKLIVVGRCVASFGAM